MRILVQKYGGTSVATEETRMKLAECVMNAHAKGYSMVVVVSAMGRRGDPYATDTLLSLLADNEQSVSLREKDLLMSCGEIISAVVVGAVLQSKGLPVRVLTGFQAGIQTTSSFGNARIINIETGRVKDYLARGHVVIVAGFQGIDENNDITTLGRGGSDTTATALGIALEAERVEIYTDVAGVMTADPRITPDAHLIKKISYQELFQMTSKGAKVVHPRAVELAMQNHIPLLVATPNKKDQGTFILDTESKCNYEQATKRFITAIAHMNDLIYFNFAQLDSKQATLLYDALAKAGVSLDLINIGKRGHSFVINKNSFTTATQVGNGLGLKFEYIKDVCKISCIGTGMHNQPGVLSQIVSTLANNNIEIIQTSDSHMTISCLVHESDVQRAVCFLHQHFFEE